MILCKGSGLESETKQIFKPWRRFIFEYTIGELPTSFVGPADDEVGERNLTLTQWVENMLQRGVTPEAAREAVFNTYPDIGDEDVDYMLQHIDESEYQDKVKAEHPKMKSRLIKRGNQANKEPYTDKPKMKRHKSAPPGYGGSLREEESS